LSSLGKNEFCGSVPEKDDTIRGAALLPAVTH